MKNDPMFGFVIPKVGGCDKGLIILAVGQVSNGGAPQKYLDLGLVTGVGGEALVRGGAGILVISGHDHLVIGWFSLWSV